MDASIAEYFDLRDALAESGCPICARVVRAGREVLAPLLVDGSPETGRRKHATALRPLCNAHAWSIHQVPRQPVGLAQSYEAFLRSRIESLQRAMARRDSASRLRWPGWMRGWGELAMDWLPRRRRLRRCPACRAAGAVERRDLGLLLDLITDMEFARAFEASGGLCLPHLDLIQHLASDHPNLPRLREVHLPKVKRLHAELQDFIRRAKAPLVTVTQEEQDTIWARLVEWTAGKTGVFGPERTLAAETDSWRFRGARAQARRVRMASQSVAADGHGRQADEVERLSLENAKLQRRLVEVSREWAEESARRAALQFQVHKLTEDVKVLELNLAGARGEAKSGELQAQRLLEEIRALREEAERLRGWKGDPSNEVGR
jgi:predicted  nucleic acid-binding Zn-ribbon protein